MPTIDETKVIGKTPHADFQNNIMTSPVVPLDAAAKIHDGARLAALRDLDLIDSGPDETIDHFTRLAGELLQVPVSLVSLLDAEHQFVISRQGLAGKWALDRQTPLNHSFCQYAAVNKAPLVIDDARLDPILGDTLAVRELNVIAYASVPLVLADGNAVGAFCAIDDKPRAWTEAEIRILTDLAAAVKSVLDLRADLAERGLHDRLTGLPNRDFLVAYCDQLLERGHDEESVAVMCVGLDHFTQVNQALGTDNADGVLKAVAERLGGVVRDNDVLGRLRGDVFTVVAPGIRSEDQVLKLATSLRDALTSTPITIGDESLTIGATVGIANGRFGARGSDMISEAANAMREAKKHRGGVWISDDAWSARAAIQLRLRDSLRGALDREEIHAVFQPIIELEGNTLRGFEALARWTSPEHGEVPPGEFVPIAELTGDIVPIGEWMIETAAGQIAAWRETVDPALKITVNVSPLQLQQRDFAERFAATLARHGLPGGAIGIEITEGDLMETGAIQHRNLMQLKEAGVRIVLDDFGTGYSALSYLRIFPIDTIKIDRSFVDTIGEDRASAALVQAMLTMSRGMDMLVVGEGVETEEQAKLLRLLGCHYGQGYLFGRPAAAADLRLS